jgi:hypothetical protein
MLSNVLKPVINNNIHQIPVFLFNSGEIFIVYGYFTTYAQNKKLLKQYN